MFNFDDIDTHFIDEDTYAYDPTFGAASREAINAVRQERELMSADPEDVVFAQLPRRRNGKKNVQPYLNAHAEDRRAASMSLLNYAYKCVQEHDIELAAWTVKVWEGIDRSHKPDDEKTAMKRNFYCHTRVSAHLGFPSDMKPAIIAALLKVNFKHVSFYRDKFFKAEVMTGTMGRKRSHGVPPQTARINYPLTRYDDLSAQWRAPSARIEVYQVFKLLTPEEISIVDTVIQKAHADR